MIIINTEKCIGCGLCARDCFVGDIDIIDRKANPKNITCINCGHCIAVCPSNAVSSDENMNDVIDYNKNEFDINPDKLLNFIKFRRSVRHFKNIDVEPEIINKIIEAGRFTQTGSNSQNVSYVVVKDGLEQLRKLTLGSLNELGKNLLKNPDNQSSVFIRYANMWLKMYEYYLENKNSRDMLFCNAPAVIVVVSDSPVNGALSSSNMELMINALGLGTYFSGFFVKAAEGNKDILEFLGLDESQKVVTCMVMGYPDVKYQRTVPRNNPKVTFK